jgi:diphthamide biosynthesis methyltransferase
MLRNQMQGLHTLVLFDLDPTGAGIGDQRPMQPSDALASIEKMATKLRDSVVDNAMKAQAQSILDSMCVLCSDLGTDDALIKTTTIRNLGELSGGRLNCMVFLASISEMEQEAINRWK